jgi:DNA-binding XRE family transcriptional regulator
MANSKFESFLKRVFKATGITSQSELASVIGVNRSAITQARKKDTIPQKWILQLYRSIPKVKARLSAGGGSFEVGTEIKGYYSFQREWLRNKGKPSRMVLMDIFGNSMEPELKDGDTVLIDESQKDILASAFYAIGVDDTG